MTRTGRPDTRFTLQLTAVLVAIVAPAMAVTDAPATAGDAQRGAQIARQGAGGPVMACGTCHGPEGQGMADFPALAGQSATYLQSQLDAMASGQRKTPVMAPIAQAMTARQRADVAAYFATVATPPAPAIAPLAPTSPERGAWIAHRGDWARGVPACASCHGPDGQGVGTAFPRLAGQPAAYIAAQIAAWKSGDRAADPQGLMATVARNIADADVAAVARYYAGTTTPSTAVAPATAVAPSSTPTARPAGSAPPTPTSAAASAEAPPRAPAPPQANGSTNVQPPPDAAIPEGPMGDMIRRGQAIFVDTKKHAAEWVGQHNELSCANCHLDAGRQPDSAPLWGAWGMYPAYRAKTGTVDDYLERLRGCFMYSMNGKAPPLDSPVLQALQAYSWWMSRGQPVGVKVDGASYPRLAPPAQGLDLDRGKAVYVERCAACHGNEGQGQRAGNRQVFPPLWGDRSFNWGAGMHEIDKAAGFIHANMPLGQGRTLTEQQAWDVAYYMDSHERPQDPRFTGDVAETRKRFHDTPHSLYGQKIGDRVLGTGTRPSH